MMKEEDQKRVKWVSAWPSGRCVDGVFLVGGQVVTGKEFSQWRSDASAGRSFVPELDGRLVADPADRLALQALRPPGTYRLDSLPGPYGT